jgi:hypothetical protein
MEAYFLKKNLTSLIESFRICDYFNFIGHGAKVYLSEAGSLPRFSKTTASGYSAALGVVA